MDVSGSQAVCTLSDVRAMWLARARINYNLGPKAEVQMWIALFVWAMLEYYEEPSA